MREMALVRVTLFTLLCTGLSRAMSSDVKVGKGSIKGQLKNGHVAFYGLPYAQSPPPRFGESQRLEETLADTMTVIDASSPRYISLVTLYSNCESHCDQK